MFLFASTVRRVDDQNKDMLLVYSVQRENDHGSDENSSVSHRFPKKEDVYTNTVPSNVPHFHFSTVRLGADCGHSLVGQSTEQEEITSENSNSSSEQSKEVKKKSSTNNRSIILF